MDKDNKCACSACCGHTHEHMHGHEGHKPEHPWLRPILSALLLAAGIIGTHTTTLLDHRYIALGYYLAAFLPVGLPVVKEAWEGITKGDLFNEFTLMSAAAIGAFAIGEYPEGVAVMLFYTVGETLQHGAVDRATRNISKLLDVRPNRTTVVRNGQLLPTAPQQVAVGETIETKPGERVPLDGKLNDNEAEFDTSALTGESAPRRVAQGGDVLAGMIVIGHPVRITVTQPYEQSTLARILHLVKEAADRKAPAELFIRKFARVYTPIVMLLAVLIVAIPAIVAPIVGVAYHFTDWLYRGLVFLVISCPCALVISVPLGYYAGIGAASRLGILFKGGNYLDALTRVNCIAFDKTGTLTKGQFEVVDTIVTNETSFQALLDIVMSIEAKSTHPIAQAIAAYAAEHNAKEVQLTSLTEIPGNGMEAIYGDKHVLVGNHRLLSAAQVAIPDQLLNQSIATVVLCAINHKFAGAFILADCLKEDAVSTIEGLKQLGLTDIHLLSGDKREVVEKYAHDLGITNAHAELLPEDKVHHLSELLHKQKRYIAFVGDGMNDAPVLTLSNVGIVMGGIGSDAAVESADIVIQNDMPSKITTAIRIARATRTVIRENIVGAIGVKVVVLTVGALGYASLWGAVFADVGVALLAVANSMRMAKVSG